MEYSGAGGKLIHEKNQKQKISWHCPFSPIAIGILEYRKFIGSAYLWWNFIYETTFLIQANGGSCAAEDATRQEEEERVTSRHRPLENSFYVFFALLRSLCETIVVILEKERRTSRLSLICLKICLKYSLLFCILCTRQQ
jgi:hypothetical protein